MLKVLRWGVLAVGLLLAILVMVSAQDDTDDVSTPTFTVRLANSVDIEIVSAALRTITTRRIDLLQQYLEIGTISIDVYAVTDYEVFGSKVTQVETAPGGTTSPLEEIRDELMEIRTVALAGADDGPKDNPRFTGPYFDATVWQDLPDIGFTTLFTGGNTQGGASNRHSAVEELRLDLAALRDNASGNIYTFTIIATVVERT